MTLKYDNHKHNVNGIDISMMFYFCSVAKVVERESPPLCMKGMDEKKVKEGDYGFLLPSLLCTSFPYFHFKRFSLIHTAPLLQNLVRIGLK